MDSRLTVLFLLLKDSLQILMLRQLLHSLQILTQWLRLLVSAWLTLFRRRKLVMDRLAILLRRSLQTVKTVATVLLLQTSGSQLQSSTVRQVLSMRSLR